MKKDENKNKIEWKVPEKARDAAVVRIQKTLLDAVKWAAVSALVLIGLIYLLCQQVIPDVVTRESWTYALYAYLGVLAASVLMAYFMPRFAGQREYSADGEGIRYHSILYKWMYFRGFAVSDHPDVPGARVMRLYSKSRTRMSLKDAVGRPAIRDVMKFTLSGKKFEKLSALAEKELPRIDAPEEEPLEIPEYFRPIAYALWLGLSAGAGYYANRDGILFSVVVLMLLFGPGFLTGALSLWHYRDVLDQYPDADRFRVAGNVLLIFFTSKDLLHRRWRMIKSMVQVLNASMVFTVVMFTAIFQTTQWVGVGGG